MDCNMSTLTACFSITSDANNERYENIEQRTGERLADQKTKQDAIETVPGKKQRG